LKAFIYVSDQILGIHDGVINDAAACEKSLLILQTKPEPGYEELFFVFV
jgi:hypothetical protein